jgi:hypothetical protein
MTFIVLRYTTKRWSSQSTMEVYKQETREVIRRFLARRLSFPDCIAALDAALAGLVPKVAPQGP